MIIHGVCICKVRWGPGTNILWIPRVLRKRVCWKMSTCLIMHLITFQLLKRFLIRLIAKLTSYYLILYNKICRANSLEKTQTLGKIESKKRKGRQRMRWLDSITDSMDMNLSKFQETVKTGKPGVLQSMWSQRVIHDLETEHRPTQ